MSQSSRERLKGRAGWGIAMASVHGMGHFVDDQLLRFVCVQRLFYIFLSVGLLLNPALSTGCR